MSIRNLKRIAAVLIAAALFVGAYYLVGMIRTYRDMEFEYVSGQYDARDAEEIVIDSDRASVSVLPANGGEITLSWYENGIRCESGMENGRITLRHRDGGGYDWVANLFRKANSSDYPITVEIPSGWAGTLRIRSDAGDVNLYRVECGGVTAELDAGSIRVSGGAFDFAAVLGPGSAYLADAQCGTLSLETGSGDVEVDGVTARAYAFVTGSGDVRLHLPGERADYSISSATGSGANGLPARQTGEGASLSVVTGSGNISARFGD